MKKAMTITYEVGGNLYLNITNRCPCACTFCIRTLCDGAYGSDPLWLEHEPSQEEIFAALEQRDLSQYREVVFCGFGEPTERLDVLLETARYLKQHGVPCIRLNTNGLSDLIHGRNTAPDFQGALDIISVSLNAGTEEGYLKVTRPKFGKAAFPAMQAFAVACKQYVPQVMLSVVDVLEPAPSQEEIFAALEQRDLSQYREVVFCGFGEPTERLDVLLETARYLKQHGVPCIRLNTNGLSDLIHGRNTAPDFQGALDIISVSLNAGTEEGYLKVTRPKFGKAAFPAMQAFAVACKQYVPQVMLSVVDVLEPAEMAAAKQLAEKLNIHLRIRTFDDSATRR